MTGTPADGSPLGLFQDEADLIEFGRWPLEHARNSGDEAGGGTEGGAGGEKRHTGGKLQHERTPEGKLRMTWRSPEWTLGDLPKDLQLSPFGALEALQSRQQCPGCGKSQHYYCFNCLKPFSDAPRLALPFHLHLVLHRNERRSMSTGIHAAVLAPDHVTVHSWAGACEGSLRSLREPQGDARGECPSLGVPQGGTERAGEGLMREEGSAVVLFPSPDAVELSSLDLRRIKRVVVVESKWQGSHAILSLPELAGLPRVKLRPGHKTCFWRYHTRGLSDECVSTVEATLWLCREWHAASGMHDGDVRSCHCFDDLLWYFAFYHGLISKE